MKKLSEQVKFNMFSFLSTFARSLVEIFISLFLFKNGFSIVQIVLFYLFANLISIPLSYLFVKLGEGTKYIYIMILGFVGFFSTQLFLTKVILSNIYIFILAFLYAVYKRGYWVARRYYITKVMPTKKSSGVYSIVMVLSQIASIAAGYVGSTILSNASIYVLTTISSIVLFISLIPLFGIKIDHKPVKIELCKNIKKYDICNIFAFGGYELNTLLSFIFPIYIALYVDSSYSLAGNLNAISNIAIILFVIIYANCINSKNPKSLIVPGAILTILCYLLKLNITTGLITIVYFVEGIVTKMYGQSLNKMYFENRNEMDLTHYNLFYLLIECSTRVLVCIPLLFINNIKYMCLFATICMFLLLLCFILVKKKEK